MGKSHAEWLGDAPCGATTSPTLFHHLSSFHLVLWSSLVTYSIGAMSDWGKARVPDPWVHLAPLNVHETTSEAIFFLLFLEDERGGGKRHMSPNPSGMVLVLVLVLVMLVLSRLFRRGRRVSPRVHEFTAGWGWYIVVLFRGVRGGRGCGGGASSPC